VSKKRVPRKVIYFSDGVLEEYSTDEEELEERKKSALLAEEKKNQPIVDLKSLSWYFNYILLIKLYPKQQNE